MSKFGWDLPPGCRISDIPGNSPEDEYYEWLCEEVEKIFPDATEEQTNKMIKFFERIREEGYQAARSDAAEELAMKEQLDD